MNFHLKLRKPPGTVVYTGTKLRNTTITHAQYSANNLVIYDDLKNFSTDNVDWVSVEGLADADKIKALCESLNVDNLVVEDIFNTNQRNKFETFNDYVFFVTKFAFLTEEKEIDYDYISLLLFNNKIITFSESENRFKQEIISRLKDKSLQISKLHEDYLFYVIYDMIIDEELNVLHYLNFQLEGLEENIMKLSKKDQVTLYHLRKNLVFLKNQTINSLDYAAPKSLLKNSLFNSYLKKYLEDLEDHMINLRDKSHISLESIRNLYDVYLNNESNRTNDIMKTLTIFSAIFIPLSFIAGIFGMNFVNFPVLQNPYGLLIFALICVLIPVGMLIYFKRKKWF
ncbi:MAG: hypothetical protein JXL85_02730 [Bacilli bacterium]|nr:hypothetical protein [Bacilli bacterium]